MGHGSPSTCRLDVELVPEPSWCMLMDTIPRDGSRLLIFRAPVQNVTWSATAVRGPRPASMLVLLGNTGKPSHFWAQIHRYIPRGLRTGTYFMWCALNGLITRRKRDPSARIRTRRPATPSSLATYHARLPLSRAARSQAATGRPLQALPAAALPTSARHDCILAARSCSAGTPAAIRALLDACAQLQHATRAEGCIFRLSRHPHHARNADLPMAFAHRSPAQHVQPAR